MKKQLPRNIIPKDYSIPVKVIVNDNRRYLAWIGGSKFCTQFDAVDKYSITLDEFEESQSISI